jgi:hypothetical protein
MDFTIDVCILMDGSGIGDNENYVPCRSLMNRTITDLEWFIALDDGKIIENQYVSKLREGTFGHHWLIEMAKNDKIKWIKWREIDRGTITALKEVHFDKEDFKYVKTAACTICKIIVTHDPDYSVKVCKILKRRLDVSVKDSRECLEL